MLYVFNEIFPAAQVHLIYMSNIQQSIQMNFPSLAYKSRRANYQMRIKTGLWMHLKLL